MINVCDHCFGSRQHRHTEPCVIDKTKYKHKWVKHLCNDTLHLLQACKETCQWLLQGCGLFKFEKVVRLILLLFGRIMQLCFKNIIRYTMGHSKKFEYWASSEKMAPKCDIRVKNKCSQTSLIFNIYCSSFLAPKSVRSHFFWSYPIAKHFKKWKC